MEPLWSPWLQPVATGRKCRRPEGFQNVGSWSRHRGRPPLGALADASFLRLSRLLGPAAVACRVGAASSPKTSSYWFCDISSSCSDDKRVAPRCDRQIAPSSLRSPECYRGGGGRGWW